VNALAGFAATATLLDSNIVALSSAMLMDVDRQDLSQNNRLGRFSSSLWSLVSPVAWALEDAMTNARAGMAQTSLKTAEGAWVDLWGVDYYGGLRRQPGELDRAYAARIVKEVTRWRLNNKALEAIVLEDGAAAVTVVNLHDQAWVMGEKYGKFAWRKYSRTTFEVLVDAATASLAALIDRSRAAGTLPFFRYTHTSGSKISAGKYESHRDIKTRPNIGGDSAWTMGGGGDAIGSPWMIPDHVEISESFTTTLPEFVSGASGPSFILGTANLGSSAVLGAGGGGVGAFVITETNSVTIT
jgi:hypothetical protein